MAEDRDKWIAKKLLEENSLAYRTVWDLYIKYYTVFLTFNVIALALTVQHVERQNRTLIVVAFVIQDLVGACVSASIASFSRESANRFEAISKLQIEEESRTDPFVGKLHGLASSPVPRWLGVFAGWINVVNHAGLIACWLAVLWM